jgi:serine protease
LTNKNMTRLWLLRLAVWLTPLVLAACGGGSGSSASDGSAGSAVTRPPVRIAGSVGLASQLAIDWDLNDGNQTGRRSNDDPASAQPLDTPVLLAGTVNQPGSGPAGASQAQGDVNDWFSADLSAGQTVEIEVGGDESTNDIDLYVISADQTLLGYSDNGISHYECVRINSNGRYLINVHAFRGAAVYNLRIGAAGTAGSCANQAAALSFNPQELLAVPAAPAKASASRSGPSSGRATALALALPASAALAGVQAAAGSGTGPQLLKLPQSRTAMAQGLNRLSGRVSAQGVATGSLSATETVPAAVMTLKYAKQLQSSGNYQGVHPNWRMDLQALRGTFPPNDPSYPLQRWHYDLINLSSALNRLGSLNVPGAKTPVVAVIDDGVMLDHTDLYSQLTSAGRAFLTNVNPGDANSANGDNPATRTDSPMFHGTHIAGLIAASAFDGRFGTGIAPMAQIMPLRVFQPGHGASTLDITNAMLYAAGLPNNSGMVPARRADVINLSLGSDVSCPVAYQNAIDQVRAAGVLVVAAAGNSSRNDQGRRIAVGAPANCRGVISVGAVDVNRRLAYYSNSGSALSLVAPGGDSSTGTINAAGGVHAIYSTIGTFSSAGQRQSGFGPMEGTSLATPHVAGVLALMRHVNPALTPAQVDALLTAGKLSDDLGNTGRDTEFGYGLINARKALDAALELVATAPATPSQPIMVTPVSLDFGAFRSSATLELKANGATTETVASIRADSPAVQITSAQTDSSGQGTYTLQVDRSLLPVGTSVMRVVVTLNPSRTLTVGMSVIRADNSTSTTTANRSGPVYVVLIDPDRNEVVDTVQATLTPTGRYVWSYAGYNRPRVAVIAGSDLNNDFFICQQGEPCSTLLGRGSTESQAVSLSSGSRSNIDLVITPYNGASLQGAAGSAGAVLGLRRQHNSGGAPTRVQPHRVAQTPQLKQPS